VQSKLAHDTDRSVRFTVDADDLPLLTRPPTTRAGKFGLAFATPEDEAFKTQGTVAWAGTERILAPFHKVRRCVNKHSCAVHGLFIAPLLRFVHANSLINIDAC
jgi:hypothetical protein